MTRTYSEHEFHDSYFHHTCLITPEKDVLETDIEGTGMASRIMRWWHNLFLLSYTCDRSRGFYTSSHAMRIERFRQFRLFSLSPSSGKSNTNVELHFSNFWDFLMLHVFIVNKIIFRFTSTFIFDHLPMYLFYFGALLELIIILDFYVTLKTGYMDVEAKRVELDTKLCFMNFCTKKLFIHYVSAIPMHWMMFLRYGENIDCGLCKTNRFTCALKIISVLSLFRIYEMSAYWTRKRRSESTIHFFKLLRIGVVGMVTMCQFYDLSDVVILLVFIHEGHVVQESMVGMRTTIRYKFNDTNSAYVFLDINRIFKALFLHSYGIRERTYYLDRLTSLGGLVLAKTFHLWSLLECYAILARLIYPKDCVSNMRNNVLNLVKSRQLSDELKIKVEEYFEFNPSKLKLLEKKNKLYRMLPEVLKEEIKFTCYIKLLMRIPFFTELPIAILEQLVLIMKKEIFLKNDIVTEASVQGDGLMIVDNGMLAVYSQHYEEQGHLIDGDYFGELSLITDKEICMSFVVAITPCTILILEKNAFRDVIRKHPQLFLDVKSQMSELYHKLVTSKRLS